MRGKKLNIIISMFLITILIVSGGANKSVLGAEICKNSIPSLEFKENNCIIQNGLTKNLEDEQIVLDEIHKKRKFEEASDDTIVCYMEGYPIKKQDIDNNYCVKTQVINKIVSAEQNATDSNEKKNMSKTQSSGLPTNTLTIPIGYNSAIIKSTIGAPRYMQTTKTYYFTRKRGAQYASALEYKSTTQLAALAAGFTPMIGPTITIVFTFSSLYKSSVASQIRERTDNGKKVKISEASSSFGTFYGVSDWSGRQINVPQIYNDGITTQTLHNLQYK